MPERIQLSRKKGFRKPEGAVVVSRPSKWGNPWSPRNYFFETPEGDRPATFAECVQLYRVQLTCTDPRCHDVLGNGSGVREHAWTDGLDLSELRGKDLCCSCPLDRPCHGDVLLELANSAEVRDGC